MGHRRDSAGTAVQRLAIVGFIACIAAGGAAQVPEPLEAVTARFTRKQLLSWERREIDGRACRVSPVTDFGRGSEVNHHRVAVVYSGAGPVELSLIHGQTGNLTKVLANKRSRTRFIPMKSRAAKDIFSVYKGERFIWLAVTESGDAKIRAIGHVCLRGQKTLYGHAARTFLFRGGKLPYRLMAPWNYDPKKSYPLVLSVSGSGGVGTDNVSNMELVILGRYLFMKFYKEPEFACFSIVPQIPPGDAIPPAYWPRGSRGGRTGIYHPDWPAVNENGWYNQAVLALIQSLLAEKSFNIDPDRVYCTGFSYGGKACWEFLKAGRGVFAAGMCGGGWPIGKAFSTPSGDILERLKLEVQRYRHIPVQVFAGQNDRMRYGSRVVCEQITLQGGKSTFLEFPRTQHVPSAAKGWGDPKHIEWLFLQNRKKNPPPGADPFPGGVYSEGPASRPTSGGM